VSCPMFSPLLLESTPDDERATTTGPAPGKATLTSRLTPRPRAVDRWSEAPAPGGDGLAPSAGAPLPSSLRARFEHSLGADLSMVRIHDGAESARSASALDARAFTVGSDIHFAAGQYQPEDPFGLHLLAHEVAHTAQQAGHPPVAQAKLNVSTPGDASEDEADRAADAMVAGRPTSVASRPAAVYRSPNGSTSASTGKRRGPGGWSGWHLPQGRVVRAAHQARRGGRGSSGGRRPRLDATRGRPHPARHLLRNLVEHGLRGLGQRGQRDAEHRLRLLHEDDARPTIRGRPWARALFLALRNSAEVTDPAGKGTDFGHIMAGLDAQNWAARTLPTGSGGTGLDVVTWLGDIGGGGGMLAMNRGGRDGTPRPRRDRLRQVLPRPRLRCQRQHRGRYRRHRRCRGVSRSTLLRVPRGVLERHGRRRGALQPAGPSSSSSSSGAPSSTAKLADESALIDKLAGDCETFGTIYAITRMQSKGAGTPATVRETGRHIAGGVARDGDHLREDPRGGVERSEEADQGEGRHGSGGDRSRAGADHAVRARGPGDGGGRGGPRTAPSGPTASSTRSVAAKAGDLHRTDRVSRSIGGRGERLSRSRLRRTGASGGH
jgi:hypothetical protein